MTSLCPPCHRRRRRHCPPFALPLVVVAIASCVPTCRRRRCPLCPHLSSIVAPSFVAVLPTLCTLFPFSSLSSLPLCPIVVVVPCVPACAPSFPHPFFGIILMLCPVIFFGGKMMSLCAFFSRRRRCPLCPPLSPSHAMRPLSFFILIAPRYAPIAPSSTSLSHCVLLVAVIVTLSRHCPLPLSSSLPPLGNCPRCPPSSSRSSSLPPLPPSHLVVTPSIPNIHHHRHASSFLNAAVPPAHSHVIVISR